MNIRKLLRKFLKYLGVGPSEPFTTTQIERNFIAAYEARIHEVFQRQGRYLRGLKHEQTKVS